LVKILRIRAIVQGIFTALLLAQQPDYFKRLEELRQINLRINKVVLRACIKTPNAGKRILTGRPISTPVATVAMSSRHRARTRTVGGTCWSTTTAFGDDDSG
jgi:hypothetical protein